MLACHRASNLGSVAGVKKAPIPRSAAQLRVAASLGTLVLATIGAALPLSMVAPTLALTAAEFGTTAAESSWTLTIVLVVAATFTPVIGRLGDIYRPRRVLLILIPIVCVGLLIAGISTSMPELIAGRALQGLGGGVFPLAISLASHSMPHHRRATAIGILTSAFATGTALGVVISGVLVDRIGTKALAWVPFVLLTVALAHIVAFVPTAPAKGRGRLHLRSAFTLAAGVLALLLAVTEAPRWPIPVLATITCVVIGVAFLTAWGVHEVRREDTSIHRHTLKIRAVWIAHVTAFLLGAALFGTFVILPVFAESASGLGQGATIAGILLLPATVAMALVGSLSGILRTYLGRRGPIILGAALTVAGSIVLTLPPQNIPSLLAGSTLAGAGIAMGSAGALNVLIDVSSTDAVAAVSSINVVARQIGGAFGAATAATLLTLHGGTPEPETYTLAFTFITTLGVAAFALSLLIPSRRRVSRRVAGE